MSAIGDAIQEKYLAFGDRIIKLNDYLLKGAANAKPSVKMVNGNRVYDKPVPVHLQSVAGNYSQIGMGNHSLEYISTSSIFTANKKGVGVRWKDTIYRK